ncbi:MAG: hypothetical protein H6918_06605 [Sphingomonadaceae bacterium]|nr:hypothetical protein [Sphingomonadaceae bacterium]
MADIHQSREGWQHTDFRNVKHSLVLSVSYSRHVVDPGHGGPVDDVLTLQVEGDASSQSWEIIDRNRAVTAYRIGIAASNDEAQPVLVVQRRGKDGQVHTNLRIMISGKLGEETILPAYSGNMWDEIGSDIDQDGTLELIVPDARFSGAFGPVATNSLPPFVYTLQGERYRDASRSGLALYYYRDLLSASAQDCIDGQRIATRKAREARAANCATYAALSARAGNWASARHRLREIRGQFRAGRFPLRSEEKSWDEAVTARLIEWGYLPTDPATRWWSYKWTDFYGDEQEGSIPFEVQQLIYDWQGCSHFSNEPTELPDGTTNEYVVDKIEQYCDLFDEQGERTTLDERRDALMQGRYANDAEARYILYNLDNYLRVD